MRILWVTRGSAEASVDAGDAIYDRRICGPLQATHAVETLSAPRGGRLPQLARAAARLSAPETFAFDSDETIERIRQANEAHRADAIVFSHEHLDRLAARVRRRLGGKAPAFVSIRHNITSDAMASILSDLPPMAALYRALAQRQERAALASDLFQGVIVLSTRDKTLVTQLYGRGDAVLAMPGAPPPLALRPDAAIARDLLLLGTYDWFPKARDLRRFVAEFTSTPLPGVTVRGDAGVPPEIAARMRMASVSNLDLTSAIRFGVITDRFTAGHKLKTTAYLMQNCAVLSFADVIDDFQAIPNATRWIHRVRTTNEIAPILEAMAARPPAELQAELTALKADVAAAIAWRTSAASVADCIARALKT